MRLYFTDGCPYAHRTRALLTLLDKPFDPVVVDLKNKPPGFLALSPTGAVPLLEDDGFVLFESAIINEYLAEKFEWKAALSSSLHQRARERLAMKRYDDLLAPLFFKALKEPSLYESTPNWRREVDLLGQTVHGQSPVSLLGLHVVTHWLRMTWLAPKSPMVLELREHAGAYLEAAAALPAVIETSPERAPFEKEMRARFGLQPLS
jgi:hypothetical protein